MYLTVDTENQETNSLFFLKFSVDFSVEKNRSKNEKNSYHLTEETWIAKLDSRAFVCVYVSAQWGSVV